MSELLQLLQLARVGENNPGKLLLVLDENCGQLPAAPPYPCQALSNRVDIHLAANTAGWPSLYSDFDFSDPALYGIDVACYRISKEKRVVEHVLQSLWSLLPVGGRLLCAGYKNEGIKTFAKRLQAATGAVSSLERGEQQLHVYCFSKESTTFEPLNVHDYHALQLIGQWQDREVWSKPGIFAWDRFDAGSLFLLEQLPLLNLRDTAPACGLDLGCGYGLLALALLELGCSKVLATDNNAAALRACEHNLQVHGPTQEVEVSAADCGRGIAERCNLILCNPPFHQGFAVDQGLGDRFLQATRSLLKQKGQALFVVNSFIPLESKAKGLFSEVQTLADNRQFKVVRLASPLP